MTAETSLKVGTRVRVEVDEDGQGTVEYGTIVELSFDSTPPEWAEEMNGTYTVHVDKKYREGPNDDGLCDVPMEYITVLDNE